jgi:hypothetical protein
MATVTVLASVILEALTDSSLTTDRLVSISEGVIERAPTSDTGRAIRFVTRDLPGS